jgi:hypothetical protein
VLIGGGVSAVPVPAFSLGPAGTAPGDAGVASARVNTSNQIGGSLGAALLNTVAANGAVAYLASRGPNPAHLAQAAVHGDVAAFGVLTAIFAVGLVITATVFPRHDRRPRTFGGPGW